MAGFNSWCRRFTVVLVLVFSCSVLAAPPPGKGKPGGNEGAELNQLKKKDWGETAVRKVLHAFAYGGLASDEQIRRWATMNADQAVSEMLTFDINNELLSPSEGASGSYCGSLAGLQAFWSSDESDNPMYLYERSAYATLGSNGDLNNSNLQLTWVKAMSTRGCNPFLHKMALFLTNYHASIHIRNTRAALIRDYYDDYLQALANGDDFIQVMTVGASHAAVLRAYGHMNNRYSNGNFYGNEDFAREYLQLFFGILGTTEDQDYYETVSIKNNALVLTGMNVDRQTDAYGSDNSGDWYVSPIGFDNHTDGTGRYIGNAQYHYLNANGNASCVEVLHADICGSTADVKLEALGPVAATHPESLANVPVKLVGFFADDNLGEAKKAEIRGSWAAANFDLLNFIRAYAVSTAFHNDTTYKLFSAFDRNLIAQNGNVLTNDEHFAKPSYWSPTSRLATQGVKVFEPVRNVFGHQTGLDAANNAFLFKDAYVRNSNEFYYHTTSQGLYHHDQDQEAELWVKDWGSLLPVNGDGEHIVADVAGWLWNRFIADGGKNFDVIARAQVQALLATGLDFGYAVDSQNPDPVPFYSSSDINGGNTSAATVFQQQGAQIMDMTTLESNERVGLAVSFITMTPYAFAMEGK